MIDSPLEAANNICPLCTSKGDLFYKQKQRVYYLCQTCSAIFMDRKYWPTLAEEKARYQEHNNDVEDKRFQKFVSPITSAVKHDFESHHLGLDFGAGTGPVITKVLRDSNYKISVYDPFFYNHPQLLTKTYDYIVSCEVIEHFHDPLKEFEMLSEMLNPNGKLYCMTHLYDASIPFYNWYYKNDLTHVFIYQKQTMDWIKKHVGFSKVSVKGKLITFEK